MKKYLILIILWLLAPIVRANTGTDADSAYMRDDFARAIELYNKALADGDVSATLYYNLGNAYYRDGKLGRAVIAYERALRIDPANADARANIAFVRTRLQDLPEDDNSFLTNLHESVVTCASANAWAWVAFGSFMLLLGAVALYIFAQGVRARKIGFFGGGILVVLTAYFIIVAACAASRIHDNSQAVVIVPTTLLNSVPRQPKQTEKVVPLHEGTKVEIIDSVLTPDDPVSPRWYNVKINNSTGAWLRATDVERI